MVALTSLWLPIVLAAAAVFVVSSIIHMATPWHKDDFPAPPNEGAVADALRPLAIPPGDYMIPRAASGKEMQSPEFQEKLNRGPVVMLTVMPNGPVAMGKSLLLWFGYSLVVGLFAGYVAAATLPAGTPYLAVFRVTGATAFAGYALALWQGTIWYRRSAATTFRSTVDGLLYALVTAGVFGWLWPSA
jgi:hypothetical protein